MTNSSHAISYSVYFSYNQSNLTIHDQLKLDKYLDSVSQLENIISIEVNSYCDDIEYENITLNLSKKRSALILGKLQSRFNNNSIKSVHWCRMVNWQVLNTHQIDEQLNQYRRIDIVFKVRKNKAFGEDSSSIQIGDRLMLKGILFEPNEDKLLEESMPALKTLFQEMIKHPQLVIQIQGHTFSSNDFSDLQTSLSTLRAKRIYDYLIFKGISPERLSYIGFENQFPLGKEAKYDRRVEIEIINI